MALDGFHNGYDPLFLEEMADVTPLQDKENRILPLYKKHLKTPYPPPNKDKEAIRTLSELLSGRLGIDFTMTDEYIEGKLKGLRPSLIKKFRSGQIPYQDYLDLHGMSRDEAELCLKDFIIKCSRRGLRCVLIIHGRGLNSPGSYPVLKRHIPYWLSHSPLNKIVLAFVSSQPYDGGTGATYVLLRKRR